MDKYIDYDLIINRLKPNNYIKNQHIYENVLSSIIYSIYVEDDEKTINLIYYYTLDKAIKFYNSKHKSIISKYDKENDGYDDLAETLILDTFLNRYPTYACIYV